VMGWPCFHSCSCAQPYPLAVTLLLQSTVEVGTLLPLAECFLATVNIPNMKKKYLFSLWPAILTSWSYESPGLLIITITHLTELLTGFPTGIEREGFFFTVGGGATLNCHSNGGPGWWRRGPLSPQLVPVTLGTHKNIQLSLLLHQRSSRESFALQRGQPGN